MIMLETMGGPRLPVFTHLCVCVCVCVCVIGFVLFEMNLYAFKCFHRVGSSYLNECIHCYKATCTNIFALTLH